MALNMRKNSFSLYLFCVLLLLSSNDTSAQSTEERPNIIIIMADDMGFDDVSFRGSNRFLTPNIDALAYSGVIINNMYTPSMCTPSRAALLTGKYPINTGMQHYIIPNDQPWGLPLNETTMAEIFRQHGYYTSLIGKWHLGMSQKAFTPTLRGFDEHYGYLGAYIDYFDHTLFMANANYSRGHDFRDNMTPSRKRIGTYVTDLLTEAAVTRIKRHNVTEKPLFLMLNHLAPHAANDDKPLQAPADEIKKFDYITDKDTRTYAAMVSKLDECVGHVIDALCEKGILNNTIILFYSDNGAPVLGMHSTKGSNYPFRGQKNSPWEGGIRSSAAIWSPQFEKLGRVWKQKIYVADMLPTLAAAADIHIDPSIQLDGVNLWSSLKYGYESVEREIVHNIDEIYDYVSYVKGKWKYVNGTTINGTYDGWLSTRSSSNESEVDPRSFHYADVVRNTTVWRHLSVFNNKNVQPNITHLREAAAVSCQFNNETTHKACKPLESPCLFDIDADPCEQNNLYEQYKNSKVLQEMLKRIEHFKALAHAPNNKPADPRSDPGNFNGEWTWWEDEKSNGVAINLQHFCISLSSVVLLLFMF